MQRLYVTFMYFFSPDGFPNAISNCESYLNSCSENLLVRWDSTGMPKEIEKLNNLPALFTVTESHCTNCSLCFESKQSKHC